MAARKGDLGDRLFGFSQRKTQKGDPLKLHYRLSSNWLRMTFKFNENMKNPAKKEMKASRPQKTFTAYQLTSSLMKKTKAGTEFIITEELAIGRS